MNVLRNERVGSALLLLGTAAGALADLDASERACVSAQARPKRIADFVAGRLLAKEALRQACGEGPWVIARDSGAHQGAPLVRGPSKAEVSISHVDGLVAAAASREPVAVDLVKLEPFSDALCDEAFTRKERDAWQSHGPYAMATAFAAKEAALKWLKTGMGMALHDLEIVPGAAPTTVDITTPAGRLTLGAATLTHQHFLAFALFPRSLS